MAGVSALAGGGSGAAAGANSAASVGGAGTSTRSAVASVGSVGANSFPGGGSVSPPSSPSPGFSVSDRSERRQPDPPSIGSSSLISSALSSIGGEPLEGSGFEAQQVHRGFAPVSVTTNEGTGTSRSSTLSPSAVRTGATGGGQGASPSDGTKPSSFGVGSDVAPVGSAGSANPQPAPANSRNALTRAVDQVRGLRRRLGSLPSDAAPHATPPRIPIDHEE